MIVMSVTDFSRNIKRVLDSVETRGEEVVLVRNKRRIGTLVPGEPFATASEAMGDLYQTLPEDAATGWLEDSTIPGSHIPELRDPWAG
ncbi:MAG: type II toxin-antitoxin system Phd/YefM family antitoxin [Spirochaetae bacterium HGW-Spirochaetae-7]|nr:MAG: type II toxin-antitoxin system Phd/YefM family antitoxin [Spirochaetae bacterium HGW-Spirochaetae-7]